MAETITIEGDYGAKLEMSKGDIDTENHPLLISHKTNEEAQLSNQQTVINLCNSKVRLTVWCMMYLIYAGIRFASSSAEHMFWREAHDNDSEYWWEAEDHVQYYSYLISSFILLDLAAALVLCNFYCCRNQFVRYLCAFLFVIGSIMNVVGTFKGINMNCGGDINFWGDEDWCRLSVVMNNIFLWFFSIYMAVDVVYSIGDAIQIRICISAVFILIYSCLHFAFWQWVTNESTSFFGVYEFAARCIAGGNMLNAIVCVFLMVCVVMKNSEIYKSIMNSNIPVAKILGVLLIVGTSFGFVSGYFIGSGAPVIYDEILFGASLTLIIPAIVLLIYDIQYEFHGVV